MPVPDALQVGLTGLLTSRAAISVTSNNISNVNTPGYTRQRAELVTGIPQQSGNLFYGTGSRVGDVERIIEPGINQELRTHTASSSRFETFANQAGQLDNLLADPALGLAPALQGFFDSVQGVANNPTSVASRQVMITQGELLASRFNNFHTQLEQQQDTVNEGVRSTVQQINGLAAGIADLNAEIAARQGAASGSPNDLLDQRDQLLLELSELVDVSTVQQSDGQMNVFIGNGQSLVLSAEASTLSTTAATDDPRRLVINLTAGAGSVPVTDNINGGKLGGYLTFQEDVLDPAFNSMGRVALGMVDAFNEQHQEGVDLNGNLGGLFFNDINSAQAQNSRVVSSSDNTGTAAIGVSIDDVNELSIDNYELTFAGGNYTLTNLTTNTQVASFAQPGTVPASVAIPGEGFSINIQSGAPADGDSFKILPTRDGANQVDVAITSPEEVAAALPVNVNAGAANQGSGQVSGIEITDINNPSFGTPGQLSPPVTINFTSATSYDVVDANSGATLASGVGFTPGQDNDLLANAGLNLGYEITLAGKPATGDSFSAQYNSTGEGDNRNALLLSGLQSEEILENGNATLQESYGRLVSLVGTQTAQAEVSRDAAESLERQTEDRKLSVSGVNLDEEAANLVRFQQSYQAAAQVIAVSQSLFSTLLNAVQ